MAKFKEADFYYGSVLSMLFNNGINPVLVEGGESRQIYEITTNDGSFTVFVKYRKEGRQAQKEDYFSWTFTLTVDDYKEISNFIEQDVNLSLALVCGTNQLNQSELCIIHKDEIRELIELDKTSITLSRIKHEKAYRVSRGGGRDNSLRIPASRLY